MPPPPRPCLCHHCIVPALASTMHHARVHPRCLPASPHCSTLSCLCAPMPPAYATAPPHAPGHHIARGPEPPVSRHHTGLARTAIHGRRHVLALYYAAVSPWPPSANGFPLPVYPAQSCFLSRRQHPSPRCNLADPEWCPMIVSFACRSLDRQISSGHKLSISISHLLLAS